MRAISLTTAMVLIVLLGACSSSQLSGPGVYYDDIYYVPGVSRDNMHQAFSPVPSLTREEQRLENRELAAQQNEYRKSQQARENEDLRDFSAIQEQYSSLLSDNNYQEVDTLLYYNDETGYWVDGFRGSSMDRSYAERIVRFHGPAVRIPYHSPFYSEVVYYNHYDWNVYVDGHYAYAFPTWTNRWYDYYYYNRWYSPSRFHFGWSYGYPYWGWGFGWNYYSPYYAWNYWHNPYWYGYNHHHFYYNRPYYSHRPGTTTPVHRGMRNGLSSDTRDTRAPRSAQGDVRSSTSERMPRDGRTATSSTTQATRQPRDGQTNRTINGQATTATRMPRTGTTGEGEIKSTSESRSAASRSYAQDAPTRRSYTPSYSQPEDNTRPTYNRASYTRVSDSPRPAQSTGTVQSVNTGTRQTQSVSTNQSQQNVQSRPAAGSATPQRATTTTPAATRQQTPVTYQRGSSTSPARTSGTSTQGTTTAPTRSSSPTPARSSSPSMSSPSRSSSPAVSTPSSSSGSSRSSGSSSGSSSSSSSSSRSSGSGRR